jgi:hypothetical protein
MLAMFGLLRKWGVGEDTVRVSAVHALVVSLIVIASIVAWIASFAVSVHLFKSSTGIRTALILGSVVTLPIAVLLSLQLFVLWWWNVP